MKTNKNTDGSIKSGQEVAKHSASRVHVDYWRKRIFKPFYVRGGVRLEVPSYSARIQHAGRRELFPCNSLNATVAAERAREIYVHLVTHGWEASLRKYKPKAEKPDRVATVGELIEVARRVSSARVATFGCYERALRTIVSEIAGIKASRDRFNYRGEGNREWKKKVDAVSLEKLDSKTVTGWRNDRIKKAGKSPVEVRKATATADSLLRCAKSLFGKKLLPYLQKEVTLPEEIPFSSARWKMTVRRFTPSVTAETLAAGANTGLKKDTEAYKAFILCLYLGLRKAEADCLTWKQINFKTGVVSIRETEYFCPKTEESVREIHLPESILEVVSKMRKGANKTFVLKGGEPRPGGRYAYYRADVHPHRTWTKLATWLRKQGIDSPKPIHDLRKMAGSLIYAAHGLEVARDFLGHNDIATTANSYLSRKPRVTVDIADTSKLKVVTEASEAANEG